MSLPASQFPRESAKSEGRSVIGTLIWSGALTAMVLAVVGTIFLVWALQNHPNLIAWLPASKQGEIREDAIITDVVPALGATALGTPEHPVTFFTIKDLRYFLLIHTHAAPHGTNLLVRWYSGDQLLAESQTDAEGDRWIPFVFEPPSPQPGIFHVDIYRDHIRVMTQGFVVKDSTLKESTGKDSTGKDK